VRRPCDSLPGGIKRGDLRFDTNKVLSFLTEMWALDMAKVTKRYDRATTPLGRTTARPEVTETDRARLDETMAAVRPGELCRQIHDLTQQLENLALTKAPAPVKPQLNRSFNPSLHPEVLGEATNQASRR
jgi:hypothetical protein